ncbi:hypothetical protein ACU3L3_07315 [Priestia endophytica]
MRLIFYSEEEAQALRKEISIKLEEAKLELEALEIDCNAVKHNASIRLIGDYIREVRSEIEGYQLKITLIDNGYRGEERIYGGRDPSGELIRFWKEDK